MLLSFHRHQGTAAGRGSAAAVEFLEEAYKVADREREFTENSTPPGGNGCADDERSGQKNEGVEGDSVERLSENTISETGEGLENEDRGTDVTGGEAANASDQKPSVIGFGVVGEEETVHLALQALSEVWERTPDKARQRSFLSGIGVGMFGTCCTVSVDSTAKYGGVC